MVDVSSSAEDLAATALRLTLQDWTELGLGDDPKTAATDDFEETVERVTALLLIRLVAIACPTMFPDISTTSICREALHCDDEVFPPEAGVTDELVDQLRTFVALIMEGYTDAPYHNRHHAYHVFLSVNKLVDLMLTSENGRYCPPTFGLKSDPLMLMALLFSALIHDVEHQGVGNRQLVIEDDEHAIRYNDQSVAENRSIFIGFSTLRKPEFALLKQRMCPTQDDYRRFRKTVVELVLATDIASPERMQIGKSKWKEAFGDTPEAIEAKVRKELNKLKQKKTQQDPKHPSQMVVKGTLRRLSRRGLGESVRSLLSEVTIDSLVHQDRGDDESFSNTPEASVRGEDDEDIPQSIDEEMLETMMKEGQKDSLEHACKEEDHHTSISRSMNGGDTHSTEGGRGRRERLHRRLSSSSAKHTKKFRQRLGIRRSMDFSGEEIETYSRTSSRDLWASAGELMHDTEAVDFDEVDELKASVVMETILKAADVAHCLQSWDHMTKWADLLYLELRRAHMQGRGIDPQNGWYENQIGFLESYLLPLAYRLDDMGVFGEVGSEFANIVESNRDRWLKDGPRETVNIIGLGKKRYPKKISHVG